MKFLLPALLSSVFLLGNVDMQNASEVITAIANTNHHVEPGLKVAKLYKLESNFFQNLKDDVLRLVNENQPSYVQTKGHVTNWTKPWGDATQFSLLNTTGEFDDTSVDHNSSIFNKKFHHAQAYPFLHQLIEMFPHATNFRINVMGPQSGLSQHEECPCMGNNKGKPMIRARFHIPIETNEMVNMFADGEVFSFKEGTLYFFNNGAIHSAENNHPTDERIHLVWDMLLTEDTFNRTFSKQKYRKDRFVPLSEWKVTPSFKRAIDPSYAASATWYSLDVERSIQLCDVQ